jgi:hypothetical protein
MVETNKAIDSYDFRDTDGLITALFNGKHFKVVRIKCIKPMTEQQFFGTLKPLVAVFDAQEYIANLERTQKLCRLEVCMQERAERAEKIARMKALAEHDPDMAEMVREYTALTSGVAIPPPAPSVMKPISRDPLEEEVNSNKQWWDKGYIDGEKGFVLDLGRVPFTYKEPYSDGWTAGNAKYNQQFQDAGALSDMPSEQADIT